MIVFDLKCFDGHVFEAWFPDGAAFEAQRKRRQIACPSCAGTAITKAPMAPRIATKKEAHKAVARPRDPAQLMRTLAEMRRRVEENCDYVGEQFPEEARRIHYGEVEERGIYGEATPDEARSLDEEGVPIQRLPRAVRQDS